jgi:hypothetical protein
MNQTKEELQEIVQRVAAKVGKKDQARLRELLGKVCRGCGC